jgi:glutamate-5-semialdehyde dehydrogenase
MKLSFLIMNVANGYDLELDAFGGLSARELHARGPMSVQHLTTEKYFILGRGHIRE